MQWDVNGVKTILETIPFSVEEVQLFDRIKQAETSSPYYRISCKDWVNVLPITPSGEAVLIKQSRVGSLTDELEVPGGVLDAGEEKDPTLAAARELEEETGFTTQRILSLGSFNPNPAIMTNQLHLFLALNVVPNTNRQHFPDEGEHISVQTVSIPELYELVKFGRIRHSLAALCVLMARPYLEKYLVNNNDQ